MKRGWWALGVVGVLAACESTSVPKTDIPDSPDPTVDAGVDGAPLPPPSVAPKVAPIGKQTIVIGRQVTFRVTLERGSLAGPLEMTIAGLPAGVTAKSEPIAAEASAADVTLSATENVAFGTSKASVQVGKDASLSAPFDLEVRGVPGTLDKSFGVEGLVSEATSSIRHITMTRDGTIVEQGYSGRIMKRRPSGEIDTTFGAQGSVELRELAGIPAEVSRSGALEPIVDDTGSIFAALAVAPAAGTTPRRLFVAKLTASGARAANFGTNGLTYALPEQPDGESYDPMGLVLLADGSLVVGTFVTNGGGGRKVVFFHFLANGTYDTTWGPSGNGLVEARSPTKRMWATPRGGFFAVGVNRSVWQEQFTKDGAPDPLFGAGQGWTMTPATFPSPTVGLFAKRADGALDFGYSDVNLARTMRFTPSGIVDSTFRTRAMTIPAWQRSSKGALVDSFGRTYFSFQPEGREADMWRFLPNGDVDTTLNGTGLFRLVLPENISSGLFSPSPTSVHELADGRIVVAAISQSNFIYRFWP